MREDGRGCELMEPRAEEPDLAEQLSRGWMLIGSSLNSSIQAIPPTLLSNFIDGSRIT
jgi:hypothetical protein